jgi:endonuclease-3 related protein
MRKRACARGASKRRLLVRAYGRLYDFFGPQHWWPGETPFEVIVGAILTQNTAWSNVEKAIANLKKAGALSARRIRAMDTKALSRLIRPAGYFNVKAKRLKHFIDHLFSRYGGSLTRLSRRRTDFLRKELLSVNGIGPETCDSILLYAFGRKAFVVDAYTRRIFSRHGILDEDASYDEIQAVFTAALPKTESLYNEYHALIVRLGKDFCGKPPRCDGCPLEGIGEISCN